MDFFDRPLIIKFELDGNDFPIKFNYDPNAGKTIMTHDNQETLIDTRDFDQLFEIIDSKFINVTDLHDREYLQSDIWLSMIFHGKDYFVIGTDYRVKHASKMPPIGI